MRITNSTLLRNYDRNLKRLAANKFNSENKVTTGRQFVRASEAPLKAAKSLNIRKALYDSAQYVENLKVADKFYTEAETSMMQISETLALVRETLIYGTNDTQDGGVDRQILAQQLETKAQEMVAIFNTDSAERAIFGGESNSGIPFSLAPDESGYLTTVLYHGVPINALQDCKSFPYSNDVLIDIGIGIQVDQKTQKINPLSALKISFNGADVTGCGTDSNVATVNIAELEAGKSYTVNVYANEKCEAVTFIAGANAAETAAAFNDSAAFIFKGDKDVPVMDDEGVVTCGTDGIVYLTANEESKNDITFTNEPGFSNNYIQITLDAARALREGDMAYANACIDRIVNATETLLLEIADLGHSEDYIAFNISRFESRTYNLQERQEELEATDLESEITLYKTYEALYNACLQMSSSVVPNSIFNYIN